MCAYVKNSYRMSSSKSIALATSRTLRTAGLSSDAYRMGGLTMMTAPKFGYYTCVIEDRPKNTTSKQRPTMDTDWLWCILLHPVRHVRGWRPIVGTMSKHIHLQRPAYPICVKNPACIAWLYGTWFECMHVHMQSMTHGTYDVVLIIYFS